MPLTNLKQMNERSKANGQTVKNLSELVVELINSKAARHCVAIPSQHLAGVVHDHSSKRCPTASSWGGT